jgi:hypothetical protein
MPATSKSIVERVVVDGRAEAAVSTVDGAAACDPRTVRSPGPTLADFLLGEERALRLQLDRAEYDAAELD